MATGFIFFYLAIYLPLFIISLYLFIKAYKKKSKFEMVMFGIAMAFCTYSIINGIYASYKADEIIKNLPVNLPPQDTTAPKNH